MLKYKIDSPVPAVRVKPGPNQVILCTVPTGSVLAVTSEPDSKGLVNVEYQGETLRVFQRDLNDRACRVSSAR
jgi:hypothetical protein